MRILLVNKSTNLDIHGERIGAAVRAGLVSQDELLALEAEHRQHVECLDRLRKLLALNHVEIDEVARDEDWPLGLYDYVISHGGDGTLLTAARHMGKGNTLVGICSTDNSVGHLCGVRRHQLEKFVGLMLKRELETIAVKRMRGHITKIDGREIVGPPVVNDILYTHAHPAGMSRYRLSVGKKSEEQKSSGIWISTSMGSTAAIKAAGGAVMPAKGSKFQYLVRERYCREGSRRVAKEELPSHLIFDPDQTPIVIFNRSVQGVLAFDGQRSTIELEFGDKITVSRADDLELVAPLL